MVTIARHDTLRTRTRKLYAEKVPFCFNSIKKSDCVFTPQSDSSEEQ